MGKIIPSTSATKIILQALAESQLTIWSDRQISVLDIGDHILAVNVLDIRVRGKL